MALVILRCPEGAKRAAMGDAEFWDHVFGGAVHDDPADFLPGWEPWGPSDPDDRLGAANPCPVCGSITTCGTDAEGRPYVHCVEVDL